MLFRSSEDIDDDGDISYSEIQKGIYPLKARLSFDWEKAEKIEVEKPKPKPEPEPENPKSEILEELDISKDPDGTEYYNIPVSMLDAEEEKEGRFKDALEEKALVKKLNGNYKYYVKFKSFETGHVWELFKYEKTFE